jgi:hypothetical protein
MKGLSKVKALLTARAKPRRKPPPDAAGAGDTIRREQIHPNVIEIVERLRGRGFHTLLVGGAVRDLLLGRAPKDFDVVTEARPEQIRRMFHNARIIGRRFRLVHLEFPGMTVEVSTFRAPAERKRRGMILRDNIFGTPEEDAFRRDFTVNALAFDPEREQVIDHVGGLPDLHARTIRTIAPPGVSFKEDPVRMLRAVRFMERLGFGLDPALEKAMRRMAPELAGVKRHRLAEETQRFLSGGSARAILTALEPFGLLAPLLFVAPYDWLFRERALREPLPLLLPYLEALDDWSGEGQAPIPPTVSLLGLVLTLAESDSRAVLLGQRPARGRDGHLLRRVNRRLHGMLGTWGLLKGQVEPAMNILAAARALPYWKGKEGAPRQGRAPPGTREAWLLLALLRNVLKLREGTAATAREAMAGLAPLPIFDHRPPGGRARAQRAEGRPPGRRRKAREAAPPEPPGPGRRRRRAKKKPRQKAAASP